MLLGLQWGDEGKGKIVDVLTPSYDIIARFQGGPNAGHTLEFEGKKYILRSIPSGIFQGDKVNVIGNGVVLDPPRRRTRVERRSAPQVRASALPTPTRSPAQGYVSETSIQTLHASIRRLRSVI